MAFRNKKIYLFLLWIIFILILILFLEIITRKMLGYVIFSIRLRKIPFIELDRSKIWNKKFIEEKSQYFQNWPIPLETFEDQDRFPSYVFKPNIKLTSKGGKLLPANKGDDIFWSSNSLGFRGPEISLKKDNNVIRIVALGASTTEGSQSDNETYPYFLEKKLKDLGYNVELINAGHHGQGISDLIALFEEKILPLSPDIVIFYEVSNNTNPTEWIKEDWQWYDWDKGYGVWFSFFHKRSAIFVFLTQLIKLDRKMPPKIPYTFLPNSPKPSLDNYIKKINQLISIAKKNNIKIVLTTFVTIAKKDLEIDQNKKFYLWQDIYLKWYPFNTEEIALIYSKFNDALKEVAIKEKVSLIDLASLYPKNPDYFIDHIHFTPSGNQLLAEYIAEFLKNELFFKNKKLGR